MLGTGFNRAYGALSRDGMRRIQVFGLLGAFGLTRVVKSLLFETSPLDPFALTVACVSMMVIGLLAGFLPAARAARVDPVTTLHDEG